MNKDKIILNYLVDLIKEPKIELDFSKDYELLIAVMLSAQATDVSVNKVTSKLFSKYDSLEKLALAEVSDVEAIIKSIGTYHKKALNVISIAKSLYPTYNLNDRLFLENLPGVGRKTANVVLANLFGENVIAVDTHVLRVSKRLGLVEKTASVNEVENELTAIFNDNLKDLHHRLVLFGRHYCKARNPLCDTCKIKSICLGKDNY